MLIIDLYKGKEVKGEIEIKAWIISNRGNAKIKFLEINDGSTFKNLQVVITENLTEKADEARLGASVLVKGTIVLTPGKPQPFELKATHFELLKNTDEDYPIQKKEITKETLREIPHLRHRTNYFRAVMRVRSTLAQEIHAHFARKNYYFMASPILTGNDGEGAGEIFHVMDEKGKYDFFGKPTFLSVTGQLHAEAYALGFGNVYTFGPTFRAENSHTQRHAAEFWMMEPEMAFTDLRGAINVADEMLKDVIKNTLEKLTPEFEYLETLTPGLTKRLENFVNTKLKIMDYSEVIEILQDVIKNKKANFEETNVKFGTDLSSEHEKYIAEKFVNGPVAVINYPKDIKAFYMHQNADGKTVASFDILAPGIGELVGGSQRECDYKKLETRMKELNIPQETLQWYLDLRRYGDSMSSGFGLGFERLIMYVAGVENIRDTLPFPRTAGTIKM